MQSIKRHVAWLVVVALAAVVAIASLVAATTPSPVSWIIFSPDPAQALSYFEQYGNSEEGIAEDMLMDPLILAGTRVVPAVLQRVTDPDMARRGYAILFLGNQGDRRAIPVLESIVRNDRDPGIRAEALDALAQIQGGVPPLVDNLIGEPDPLGMLARQMRGGNWHPRERRSLWAAAVGRHE